MITIWHNPRCSKSRQTLAIIEEKGDVKVRKYLEESPSSEEIQAALALLQMPAIKMMRPAEPEFQEMGLSRQDEDEKLIAAMAACPKLIERPIVFTNGKACIGRPPESVLQIL